MNGSVIGKCSLCGGAVLKEFLNLTPTFGRCNSCGAVEEGGEHH